MRIWKKVFIIYNPAIFLMQRPSQIRALLALLYIHCLSILGRESKKSPTSVAFWSPWMIRADAQRSIGTTGFSGKSDIRPILGNVYAGG